ncbi:MAG TPA: DUF4258 domain-containing protein [Candidatus Brocadiia bacterium]|nr:DUF4258 domain-containing protein [Planctomycetota bacterium]MDO8092908.1 DUF4258 domain-containing protein [Candidatus Brocadiales bacterium]
MIDEIIGKIQKGLYEYSQHAVDQSVVRMISTKEVQEAIEHGKIIENYPDDKYGPRCLIYGKTTNGRPIHVQCSYPSRPLVKIITIYEPDPELWTDFEIRR